MFKVDNKPVPVDLVFLASAEENLQKANAELAKVVGRLDVTKEVEEHGEKKLVYTHGSCFLYSSSSSYFLTCNHVVDGAKGDDLVVIFRDEKYNAEIVHSNPKLDLALIKLTEQHNGALKEEIPYLKLAPQVVPGNAVFVGGFRMDKTLHVTFGFISNSNDIHTIVADCTSDNGTSGGPAIGRNMRKLLGIVKEGFGVTQISTSLIPPLDILHFFNDIPDAPQPEIFDP